MELKAGRQRGAWERGWKGKQRATIHELGLTLTMERGGSQGADQCSGGPVPGEG